MRSAQDRYKSHITPSSWSKKLRPCQTTFRCIVAVDKCMPRSRRTTALIFPLVNGFGNFEGRLPAIEGTYTNVDRKNQSHRSRSERCWLSQALVKMLSESIVDELQA